VSIHLGVFYVSTTRAYLANPPACGPKTAEVIKTEEKGSDVALATYLMLDACRGDCETAVLITNDSDLREPLRLVRDELGLRTGVINRMKLVGAVARCRPRSSSNCAAARWPPASSRPSSMTPPAGRSPSLLTGEGQPETKKPSVTRGPRTQPPKRLRGSAFIVAPRGEGIRRPDALPYPVWGVIELSSGPSFVGHAVGLHHPRFRAS